MTIKNKISFLKSLKNQIILASKVKSEFYDDATIEKIKSIEEKIAYLNSLLDAGMTSETETVINLHK
jgi:hypothetical protein